MERGEAIVADVLGQTTPGLAQADGVCQILRGDDGGVRQALTQALAGRQKRRGLTHGGDV
ncbi:hypothetical protein D3C75_1361690 [compost metagenome]